MTITKDRARQLLAASNGNVSEAARRAGMSRATWRCKFGGLGMEKPAQDVAGVGLAVFDIHFPHEDQRALDAIANYVNSRHNSIDYLILGGDICDFHMISRWDKDPFGMPLHEEIDYARTAIEDFVGRFSVTKRKVYIQGNHEERLQKYLHSCAPEISKLRGMTVQEQLGLESLGVEYIDNKKLKHETKKYFSIGKLHILHGHEQGICPSVNPARRYLSISGANIMVGHVHKKDEDGFKTIENKSIGAWVVGAACDLYPDYRPQNNWKGGFAVIEWDDDGCFRVNNREVDEGVVR